MVFPEGNLHVELMKPTSCCLQTGGWLPGMSLVAHFRAVKPRDTSQGDHKNHGETRWHVPSLRCITKNIDICIDMHWDIYICMYIYILVILFIYIYNDIYIYTYTGIGRWTLEVQWLSTMESPWRFFVRAMRESHLNPLVHHHVPHETAIFWGYTPCSNKPIYIYIIIYIQLCIYV